MANDSYQSLGSMSYRNRSSVSGGQRPQKRMPKVNKKAAIGAAVLLVGIVLLVKLLGGAGSNPEKIAKDFIKRSYSMDLPESYLKKRYPAAAAEAMGEVYHYNEDDIAQMREEMKDLGFKIGKMEVLGTERVENSELSRYEDYISEIENDAKVTAGTLLELEVQISMKDSEAETVVVHVLVLTCNGKTGVWGIGNGRMEYMWEMF